MPSPPKITVTFFFSDIEGSTQLAHRLGGRYGETLEEHRHLIRFAVARHGGREIDTAGDGFFVVFPDPVSAMKASVEIQQAVESHIWPEKVRLRIRIGLHEGEAFQTGKGYTGIEVHRAARICDFGNGGHILLSGSMAAKVRDQLPEGVRLFDLGDFQLKDFVSTERLFQLQLVGVHSVAPLSHSTEAMPVVAVLPFSSLDTDPENEYLCDGIAEELIIGLGRVPGLRVVARSASFALKGETTDPGGVGKRLNASAILSGSVRRSNGKLQIMVELAETETGFALWSERFDRKIGDVISIQDEIARHVISALQIKRIQVPVREIQSIQTHNIEAYDFYLRGRKFFYQFSRQGIDFALRMFRQAIALDARYALAWCGIADCQSYRFMYVDNLESSCEEALRASNKAIQLDPLLAEAHASRGWALSIKGDYAGAEDELEEAIELDPFLFEARYLYARVSFAQGQVEKAGRLYEEANKVRPEDYQSLLLGGQMFEDLGKIEKSKALRKKGVRIAEAQLRLNPGDTRALYMGANGLVAIGEREQGIEWLQRALALEPSDAMLLYNAGCIYAMLGMTEESLACLSKSMDSGLIQKGWYLHDSNLDSVRGDPRFEELMARL
jgi:adenylate cyclase